MSDLSLPEPVPVDEALDIQHDTDPASDHGNARRIPHLGHALCFFGLLGACILIVQLVLLVMLHATTPAAAMQHPFALALGLVLSYTMTFAIAIPVFRMVWNRPFLEGISWTWRAASLRWGRLLLMGCILSVVAQLLEHWIKSPVESDVVKLLQTPLSAWFTVVFGTFIAPVVEEISFRGFLLPALATAYDWLALERTPAGRDRWHRTTSHTRGALFFGAIVSSIAFASIHGGQLHWATGMLIILFLMSLAFSAVRIQLRSVAASVLLHIAYNSLIFIEVIWATGAFHHLDKLPQ